MREAAGSAVVVGAAQAAQAEPTDRSKIQPVAMLDELERAVQAVLESKRIGQPVFIRWTVQASDQEGKKELDTVLKLDRMSKTAQAWVGKPIDRLFAVGSLDDGQVCLTLQFRGGATALLSLARGAINGHGVDLMVIGNRGAIYHDTGLGLLWDALPEYRNLAEKDLTAGFREALGKSLRQGVPVPPAG